MEKRSKHPPPPFKGGINFFLPSSVFRQHIIIFSGFVYHETISNFALNQKAKEMGKIGLTEIILILLVVVLLFGGRKIPELMKGIGQGMKEFKKASKVDGETESKETFK
jgi:sec-independent protein translocase protein TatA